MNHIVNYSGKKLVFKSRPVAVMTAKRKVMLGIPDVSLSTGYPGVFDDAKTIKKYADTAWFNRDTYTDNTGDHWCDKCHITDSADVPLKIKANKKANRPA